MKKTIEQPDEKKWVFESEEDKLLGIETWQGATGEKEKRVSLSDGRTAVARRLKGKDAHFVQRHTDGNPEKFQDAIMALCITIDGEKIIMEELEEMWYDDFTKLQAIAAINFPTTRE